MVSSSRYAANMLTTAMLVEDGIKIMRQNIRRRHPEESEAAIDARLDAWLCRKDDAISGDVGGSVRVRDFTE